MRREIIYWNFRIAPRLFRQVSYIGGRVVLSGGKISYEASVNAYYVCMYARSQRGIVFPLVNKRRYMTK
jgi:hypothetical protein